MRLTLINALLTDGQTALMDAADISSAGGVQ